MKSLILEFTFPMMFRWFLYIKGALSGSPADRLRTRETWIRRVVAIFWHTDQKQRVAIRIRLNSLFDNDYQANINAQLSSSGMALIQPNSLTSPEAADLMENYVRNFGTVDDFDEALYTATMGGKVSVLEAYWLGFRVLGVCGTLARFRPHWDQVTSTPVRRSAGLVKGIPMQIWNLSTALLLARQLDLGLPGMFHGLK